MSKQTIGKINTEFLKLTVKISNFLYNLKDKVKCKILKMIYYYKEIKLININKIIHNFYKKTIKINKLLTI